ncbi:MAG TPA: hypothetical protein VHV77_01175, partial [Pirellulales bacterium]|nr:hypothetical protein [Pirellulales bacterium]
MGRRASKALVCLLITAAQMDLGGQLMAQAPVVAPAPVTLWNFLGIPQGVNKIKDATSNKFGNHPALERKPPLKSIADPANLASKNPAIASAAQIKQEEDLAPQKIKAIKYLATIGCGCYDKKIDPPVKVALMAALDDCTERVRFEAAKAIGEAAATKCVVCGQNCCCDEDMAKKLAEIAFERSEDCCWLEPSERVRNSAREALQLCCRSRRAPPDAVPVGPSEVVPEEQRDVLPQPEQRDVLPMAPMPIPQARRPNTMPSRAAPQSVGATSRNTSNAPMAPPARDSKPLPMPVVKTPAKMPTPTIVAPANRDSAQQKTPAKTPVADKPVADKPVAEKQPSSPVEKPQVSTPAPDTIKKLAMTTPAAKPVIKIAAKGPST